MIRRYYNLALMLVWLGVAAVTLFPDRFFPGKAVPGGPMAGVLALTLAAYNLVRWWAYRSLRHNRPAGPNPLAARRRRDEGEGDAA
ncbi:MAG: hypothetical protein K2X87_35270 [Gemmataceae bacterium]|nr:hypothetical protein [Gemmataceae bacterium]